MTFRIAPQSLRRVVLIACALTLSACGAIHQLRRLPPAASEADATRLAGRAPEHVWQHADGTRTLEYTNQPLGGDLSYQVTIGRDGKVLASRPIQIDPATAPVTPGMTQDEILRLLGTPRTVATYMSGEEIWDWNTPRDGFGYLTRYNVHFRNGLVVRTSTRTIDPNDCRVPAPC